LADLVAITPRQIETYLMAKGWCQGGVWATKVHRSWWSGECAEDGDEVVVPITEAARDRDYALVVSRFVKDLAAFEGRRCSEVWAELVGGER
jgi:hypothetical protein